MKHTSGLIFNFWSKLVHFVGLSWYLPPGLSYLNLPLVAAFSMLLAPYFFLAMAMSGLPTSLDPNLLQSLESKSATEEVPPVSCHLVEKFRSVNMADLLQDDSKDTQLSLVNGQLAPSTKFKVSPDYPTVAASSQHIHGH